MKKIACSLLSIMMLLGMIIPMHAAATQSPVDVEIAAVLNNQLSQEDRTLLYNTDDHHNAIKDIALNEKPILRIYNSVFWESFDNSIADIVQYADNESQSSKTYIVLDLEKNIQLLKTETDPLAITSNNIQRNYIEDIRK